MPFWPRLAAATAVRPAGGGKRESYFRCAGKSHCARPWLSEREVELLDALALGGLAAAVVTGGGDDGGVAGELLGRRAIHAGVEQVGTIMWTFRAGCTRAPQPLQPYASGGVLTPERAVADVLADHGDAFVASLRHDRPLGDARLRGRRGQSRA